MSRAADGPSSRPSLASFYQIRMGSSIAFRHAARPHLRSFRQLQEGRGLSGGGGELDHFPENAMGWGWVAALSLVAGVPVLFWVLVLLAKSVPTHRFWGIILIGIGVILLILTLSL